MDEVDVVVVGAGVVGLAVARQLARDGREVVVLEAERQAGTGISSRNSEVIHAGIYYPAGSLRAELCVRGKALLYAFCQRHQVPHQRCGKLIVATDAPELAALDGIRAAAAANGVHDLQPLTAAQATALEPALRCTGALLSPSTGIVDSHGLMLALRGDAEAHGAVLALGSPLRGARLTAQGIVCRVGSIEHDPPDRRVHPADTAAKAALADETDEANEADDGPADRGNGHLLRARALVNCAGLQAVAVAAALQGLPAAARQALPVARMAKGSYFSLSGRSPFARLVYPAPGASGHLGVHLTLDLAGQARFGPGFAWVDRPDHDVQPDEADGFYAAVRRYWPGLPDGALQPGYAGIRPKISGPGEPAADFRIDGPAAHGVPGLVNLFGIESPGLTACLALAERVAQELGRP